MKRKQGRGQPPNPAVDPVPPALASLTNWYDFSDITQLFKTDDTSTPVTANGDDIGHCANKGSGSEPVVQSEITLRPHWDTTTLLAASAASTLHVLYDDSMALVPTTAFTVACLVSGAGSAPGTDYVYLFGATSEARHFCVIGQTGTVAISANDHTHGAYTDGAAFGTWSKSTATGPAQLANTSIDVTATSGTETHNPPDATDKLILMGQSTIGGFPWKGNMGEWLCWNTYLSTADLALLETYFTDKWGVTWA